MIIDARGLRCPQPVIELARLIEAVEVGEVIGVAATDAAARIDIPAWCRLRGHEYAGEEAAADGVPVYRVRRLQ